MAATTCGAILIKVFHDYVQQMLYFIIGQVTCSPRRPKPMWVELAHGMA